LTMLKPQGGTATRNVVIATQT